MATDTGSAADTGMHRPGGARAWLIWFIGANCFFFAFFQRASPSVMVEPIMDAFNVGGALLGNLSAFYFYAYAALQIPVGLMLDRWGPRKLLAGGMVLVGVGAGMLGMATIIEMAYLGRLLVGAGSAVAFISTLTLCAQWFAPGRFGMLSGMTMGYAMFGGFLGQGPLGGVVEEFGWRNPMIGSAAWGLALAVLIWMIVRDRPDGQPIRPAQDLKMMQALKLALAQRQNWVLGFYGFAISAPFLAYGVLWAVPHIMAEYGVDRQIAGFSASLMMIGFAFGGPLGGFISDVMGSRKKPLMFSASISLIVWVLMLYVVDQNLLGRQLFIFAIGVVGGASIVTLAAARENSPSRISGAVTGFVNGAFVAGGAVFQPLVGFLLDRYWQGQTVPGGTARIYSLETYDIAFVAFPAAVACAVLMSVFIRETGCKPYEEQ